MFEKCNDLFRILKYILFNPGCTIDEIAASLEFTTGYIIKIILSIHDDPMNLFTLTHKYPGTEGIDIFTDITKKQLIAKVQWYIDSTNMDIIPIRNFDNFERKLLETLIETSNLSAEVCDFVPFINENNENEIHTVFLFDIPSNDLEDTETSKNLKIAIQGRNYVKVFFYDSLKYEYVKPLGFLHNEQSGEWSLICQDELQIFKTILLRKIKKVEILHRTFSQGIPINLDLVKSQIREKEVEVELIIQNHETVLDKMKKQLAGMGEFVQIDGGKKYFKGRVSNIHDFKTLIMRMGSSVQVVVPEDLRNEIIKEAEILLAMHEQEFSNEYEYLENGMEIN